jgi:hypothetical protein
MFNCLGNALHQTVVYLDGATANGKAQAGHALEQFSGRHLQPTG